MTETLPEAIQANRESILTAETAPDHKINFETIPAKLKSLKRWVNWKWSRTGNKWTKVPCHPKGFNASSTDSETWSDFETVCQAVSDHGYGIGFVFNGDGLVGIDIDDCRNPNTGEIAPWAMYVIQTLDSYAEISPSGTGVKLFLMGQLPDKFRKKHNRSDAIGGVEIFSSGRFFTVTGLHTSNTPIDVQDRNEELNRIYLDVCDWKPPAIKQKPSTYSPTSYQPSGSDRDTALLALGVIGNNPGIDYDDWLNVGMALHAVGNDLLGDWEAWSQQSEKYVAGECARKWNSFTGGKGIGIGTLCHMADSTGRTWRPIVIRNQVQESPEDKLKGAIELAYLELNSGSTVEEVSGNIINVISQGQRDKSEKREPDPEDPGPIPQELLDVGGLWGEIIEYNLQGAIRPQRELALAGSGALLGTIYGRKVQGHLRTRTNVYIIGLGESGCGKEQARTVNKTLLKSAGMSNMMPCEDVASGAGLIDAVALQPAMLLMVDEIHKTLAATKDASKNPHMFEVVGILLKLFTSAGSEYLGKAFAGRKKETRIDQPCLSLYGTGIPRGVWQSLTTDQLSDGFLSRLLIIESSNSDPTPVRNPDCSPPATSLIEQIGWWGKYDPPGNELNCVFSVPRIVVDAPGVTDVFADGEDYFRSLRRPDNQADGLWTRATEKARKLALIHQLSRNREAVEIDEVSARWALDFVEHVTRRTLFHANVWVADTSVGINKLSVLRTIREMGGRATTLKIARANRGLAGKQRNDIISDLLAEGSIRVCPAEAGETPTLTYELVG